MRAGVSSGAVALLIALVPGAAFAQYDDDWRYLPPEGHAQTLDRILPEIRRNHPGRFYDAEGPFQEGDGQMHYRLKWMTPEGRVVWFDTDARTGRVLGTGGGRHGWGNDGYPGDRFDDRGPPPSDRPHFGGPEDVRPFEPHGWDGGRWNGRQGWGGGHWGGGHWGGGDRDHGHDR